MESDRKPEPAVQPVIQATPDHRPPTTGHRPPVTEPRSPTTDHRPPVTDPRSPSTNTKTRSWGDVKLGNIIPDLNKVFEEKQEVAEADEPELLSGEAREPFNYDQLLKEWHAVADKLKAENKINLFTLMTANPPQLLADFRVGVTVENPIQLDLLNISKIDMLNELRIKLRNFAIDLVPIEVASDVVRKPYTAQEKYQAMVAKNPALDVLRKTFNLGLE